VVFIPGVNHPLAPLAAATIQVFKHHKTGRGRILEVVFPHHNVEITVTINVDNV
jgi:hypothetical protein